MRLRHKKWAPAIIARHPDTALGPEALEKGLPLFDCLEIGSGRGRFLLEKAKANPTLRFLGIEINYNAFSIAIKKSEDTSYLPTMKNYAFLNVPFAKALPLMAKGSVREIYLNFPDPWPKKRQFKRRLTFPSRLAEYYGLLKKGGKVFFKTDNKDLFSASEQYFAQFGGFAIEFSGIYEADDPSDVMTEFEAKFRGLGQPIYRIVARKE